MDRAAALVGIQRAFHRLARFLAQRSLPDGITLSQFLALLELRAGTRRPSDLAGWLGVTPGAVTPLTDRLIEAGWVARTRDTEDRRVLRLSLTEAGAARLREIEAHHRAVWERLMAGLDDRELGLLRELVARVAERSEGLDARARSESRRQGVRR